MKAWPGVILYKASQPYRILKGAGHKGIGAGEPQGDLGVLGRMRESPKP